MVFGIGVLAFYATAVVVRLGAGQFRQQVAFGSAVLLFRISWRKIMLNLVIMPPVLALIVKLDELLPVLATTVIFVAIGLIVFALAFLIVVLVAPFSVKKEIEEDQNTSLAVIIGAVIIGIAMIISAAIQGN